MPCSCPCHENCKHEYATLLAIDDGKFKEVKLMPVVDKSKFDLTKFIKSIPADELKEYIVEVADNNFEELSFNELKEYFMKYQSKETGEYYYNLIYNAIAMDELSALILEDMAIVMRKYISIKEYEQVYVMFTSIIDSIVDAINNIQMDTYVDKIIDVYSKIVMFARISYRKGSNDLKEKYDLWLNNYECENYYEDVFLEDLLLSIKK